MQSIFRYRGLSAIRRRCTDTDADAVAWISLLLKWNRAAVVTREKFRECSLRLVESSAGAMVTTMIAWEGGGEGEGGYWRPNICCLVS
jgi:hypothetical protein